MLGVASETVSSTKWCKIGISFGKLFVIWWSAIEKHLMLFSERTTLFVSYTNIKFIAVYFLDNVMDLFEKFFL